MADVTKRIGVRVGIIGCGNLGSSLVRGFLRSGLLTRDEIMASDVDERNLRSVSDLGIGVTSDNDELVRSADVVFISVKPDAVESVLRETLAASGGKLFVSLAAGVSTGFVEARTRARVARAMPNMGASVAEMASGFSLGASATEGDEKLVEKLLGGLGTSFRVEEGLIEAVTGVSGSGPAFFYQIIKAMRDAGVELGLPDEVALRLAAQTAKGAGETVLRSGESVDDLTRKVCTPRGTTIEGIRVLERGKVAESVKEAVKASANRARELSR